jgi:tetratricopeptide (TPR) repeat protein
MLAQALLAFEEAAVEARLSNDHWLSVRADLGAGVVYQSRGNYPAARALFSHALNNADQFVDLQIGAHLGIVSAARATEEYDLALGHGWQALQLARGNAIAEVEALTILAGLSLDVGEFAAAISSCHLAMSKSPRPPMRAELVRYIVHASLGVRDDEAIRMYLPELTSTIERTPIPWQEAQGRRVLAEVFRYRGDQQQATLYLEQTRAIASRHGYKKLLFMADEALAQQPENGQRRAASDIDTSPVTRSVVLTEESQTVIDRLACLTTG